MIDEIANPRPVLVGEQYDGTVVKTTTFGAFVNLVPGRDGLVHISKLGKGKRLSSVEEAVKEGDSLTVLVEDIDTQGKISLKPVGEEWAVPEGQADESGGRDRGNRAGRRRSRPRRPRCVATAIEAATGAATATAASAEAGASATTPPGRRRRTGVERRTGVCRGSVRRTGRRVGGRAAAMPIERTEFSSGLRVVTERMPSVRSVSLGFWVLAGSRDERPRISGSSHFLEHLLFKGTDRRSRPGHRGELRRGRWRRQRVHRARVHLLLRARARPRPRDGRRSPRRHGAALGDPGRRPRRRAPGHPRRDQHARGLARGRRARPLHADALARASARAARSSARSRRSLAANRASVRRFYGRHYVPGNLVVAAAGNLRHDDLVRLLRQRMDTGRRLRRAQHVGAEPARARAARRSRRARTW